MMLCQMIYTSTSAPHVTLADKVNVAAHSVFICKQLGLTGRVLVVPEMAINVLEGPEDIIRPYVEAIRTDSLIDDVFILQSQQIESHEFEDYSVWMTYKSALLVEGVHRLTVENYQEALPKNLPSRTRFLVEANFTLSGLAA